MKISTEQYERLMRFLDLDMSVGEMKAFAEELKTNPDLRDQLEFEEAVRDGLETLSEQGRQNYALPDEFTEEEIAQFRREMEEEGELSGDEQSTVIPFQKEEDRQSLPVSSGKKGKILAFSFSWAVAASLLMAVGLVYLFSTGSTTSYPVAKNTDTIGIKKRNDNMVKVPEDTMIEAPSRRDINFASLFSGYYKKDTIPQQKPDIYASALDDYNDDYYRTIQKIDAFNLPEVRGPQNDPLNNKKYAATIGHYYTGISFIETNNLPEAIKNLQWVKDSTDDKTYAVKSQWYLALAYLKSGKTDRTKQLLRAVADNNLIIYYKSRAQELLEKMK